MIKKSINLSNTHEAKRSALGRGTSGASTFYFWIIWVAALISLPLLNPGYILTLDMNFGPHIIMSDSFNLFSYDTIRNIFLVSLNFILPAWIIQKILLFLIFILSGIGMYNLVPTNTHAAKRSVPEEARAQASTISKYIKLFAAILYMVNPFVYSRLFAGQIFLLLGYAIMPFIISLIFSFLEELNIKSAIKFAVGMTILLNLSVTFIYLIGLIFVVSSGYYLFNKNRIWERMKKFIIGIFVILCISFILNANWIIPVFSSQSPIPGFGEQQRKAFITSSDPQLGTSFNVLSMYGFWGENMQWSESVVWPKDILPLWPIFFLPIFSIIIYGLISGLKDKKYKKYTTIFAITGIISFIFSIGIANDFLKPINEFFHRFLPFFNGFRDSQKWSMILILSYCILGSIGLNFLTKKIKNLKLKSITPILAIGVVLIYTFPIFTIWTQINQTWYPASWGDVNNILNEDQIESKVLFLPWHMYMSFDFSHNRIVANPARKYFDKSIIQGENMEIANIYSASQSPIAQSVELILFGENDSGIFKDNYKDSAKEFKEINVKYIILAKTVDFEKYLPIFEEQELQKIYDSNQIALYKNTSF